VTGPIAGNYDTESLPPDYVVFFFSGTSPRYYNLGNLTSAIRNLLVISAVRYGRTMAVRYGENHLHHLITQERIGNIRVTSDGTEVDLLASEY
jgi:hypothetical protein